MADYGSNAYDKQRAEEREALAELGFVKWDLLRSLVYMCIKCSSLVVSGRESNYLGLHLHNKSLHLTDES